MKSAVFTGSSPESETAFFFSPQAESRKTVPERNNKNLLYIGIILPESKRFRETRQWMFLPGAHFFLALSKFIFSHAELLRQ